MKNLLKTFAIVAFIVALSITSQAQNPVKIGYIDLNKLLPLMPGIDSVDAVLQKMQKSFIDELGQQDEDIKAKENDFNTKQAGMIDEIKTLKREDIDKSKRQLEENKLKAQDALQAKQQDLLQPFYKKAQDAIKEVAKENKYTYILNGSQSIVLYSEPTDDVMPLVMKKLGIK